MQYTRQKAAQSVNGTGTERRKTVAPMRSPSAPISSSVSKSSGSPSAHIRSQAPVHRKRLSAPKSSSTVIRSGNPSAHTSSQVPVHRTPSVNSVAYVYNDRRTAATRSSAGAVSSPTAKPKRKEAKKTNSAQVKSTKRKIKNDDPNRIRFWYFDSKVDVPMLMIILALLVFGITMMFSAGHALSYRDNHDSYYFVRHQIIAAAVGLVGMFFISFFDYRFLRHEFNLFNTKIKFTVAHIILAFTIILNLMVIPFGIRAAGGQKRWLPLPFLGQFQPSDFLKVSVIIFLAYYIHKNSPVIRRFYYGLFKPGLLMGLVLLTVLPQTHMSCLLIVLMVSGVMLFVGGANLKYLVPVIAVVVVAIVLVIVFGDVSYFGDRVKYMDPMSEPGDGSYQNYQAALAVGSGGIWGKGFGNSSQKYYYLPEAQNDFVYAILVEEFGLIGGVTVIVLFLIFIMRGFYIARKAEDKFGCLLATGITFQIGLQAFLNIAVNLCCIPNTGISMPFFSYGGTALMLQLWEMGLLLSVSKRARLK